MSTIDHIRFNGDIYRHATNWSFLLYQLDGISVTIPVPNADVISFIQIFDNLSRCVDRIERNSGKLITLFTYEKNLQQWLTRNSPIPNNIQHVKIFCHSDDHAYLTHWIDRYRHRYENLHFENITFDNLNYILLAFGLEHIRRVREEFREDFGVLNLLDRDYRRICQSLGNYALDRANIEVERIRQSEEAQN